ncbi:MAG TPA: hypothetical protein PLL30_09250 [Candidatus Krumholzibacteria bacterium]|nr:hypothetical protein [Candidatus Krumholzibacteria bacterium]HPD71947.1 hypothetical protein [Candidatus Krumholzibacteria bacterium]HRY41120.1 hypothetical protein [Candidatus Krumholzibacteria bacterium]
MTKTRVTLLAALAALIALAVFGGCRSAHTTSAILYIEQEQYQKAIDVITEGLYFQPDDAEGYYYQGEAYSRMAQQAIDENDYLLAKNSFTSAYGKFMQARQMDPEGLTDRVAESLDINYRNTLREGQTMWRERHYEEAEGFFRLAYAALPDSLESVKSLAGMKIQQAEVATPDSASLLRNEALTLLDQVLVTKPEAYRLLADKAYVLTQLDRTDEAQVIYDQLLTEHGDDAELLLDVVGLYNKQQRYADAGQLFLRIADLYLNDTQPDNDEQLKGLYAEAGYNFRLASDYERAIDAYGLASEQDVTDVQIMLERQQLYLQYGQDLLMKSTETMTSDPAAAARLKTDGMAVLQRGVEVGVALTNLAPNNADAFLFLANTQGLLGDETGYTENMKTYQELSGNQ